MQTLTIGDVTFVADQGGLALLVGDGDVEPVRLSPRQAGELEDFLRRHAPRERRVGFRVPLGPLGERVREAFRVQVGYGQRPVPVRPVDFSLTGILVQAPGLQARRGQRLIVHLTYERLVCHTLGVVVRLQGDLVALHFLESLKHGDLNPPEALMAIYRNLELAWLRSRKD